MTCRSWFLSTFDKKAPGFSWCATCVQRWNDISKTNVCETFRTVTLQNERVCFPAEYCISVFVFGSTDIVAMGNCTILSCSLVPLYRKVFWLVYLLWVGIKLHLGNRPPTTIPPAISPQVSEWMSEWVSGSQVYLSNSPTTTQHCISLESTPHIRLRNNGHLCFYDSFSQGSHCTACTKHWPNIVVNLACGHSDLNSPAPHCATHCFYAKSSTGQNKIDGCLRPRPPRSQLASIPDPRPFLIHSDPESFSFARLTDLLVFVYSDVHLG